MCMNKESTFTRIISGELPSHTIYEDETIYAFLDADPHASGHTLVIPKQPYERLHELPKEEAMHLFETLWELVPIIESAVEADATTLVLNNGPAADQEIPHVHWHIVPRFESDGTLVEYTPLIDGTLTKAEMDTIAANIRTELRSQ